MQFSHLVNLAKILLQKYQPLNISFKGSWQNNSANGASELHVATVGVIIPNRFKRERV